MAGITEAEMAIGSEEEQPSATTARCRAMMQVVRKEDGRWMVSKVVEEHNHELLPTAAVGNGALAAACPVVGMEFNLVDDAREFYSRYGESSGFKVRNGSNRQLVGKGSLIMQRWLCWRGNNAIVKKKKGDEGVDDKVDDKMEVGRVDEKHDPAGDGDGCRGKRKNRNGSFESMTSGLRGKKARGQKRIAVDESAGRVENTSVCEEGRGEGEMALDKSNLGTRTAHFSGERRTNIVNKCSMKQQGRTEQPAEVASQQSVAERRVCGNEGRFSAGEEPAPLQHEQHSECVERRNNKKKDVQEELSTVSLEDKEGERLYKEQDPSLEIMSEPGGEPKIGMVFLNEDKAYDFYVSYASSVGFSIRKGSFERTGSHVTKSRVFVCSKEGSRPKNAASELKKPRAEIRTGCQARMTIKINESGKYVTTDFVREHNHQLEAPIVDIQTLVSQKLLAKAQPPRELPRDVLIPADYKNYLRTKRTTEIQTDDCKAILQYLQKMKAKNPSFFYSIQVDEDDRPSNVFWTDSKSMIDYSYFGDVVCFDTRYSTCNYGRPFALFVGVNHHRQAIVMGAALIYDESVESFKWLLEAFKSAMCGKQPKTFLTDQWSSIAAAVTSVWPGTTHILSTLHLCQSSGKILSDVAEGSEAFLDDFRRCLYDIEGEEEFIPAWEMLLDKYDLRSNDWLSKLFEVRTGWALPYIRNYFCADITAILRNDNMEIALKDIFDKGVELTTSFKHYEKYLNDRRLHEQQADYFAAQVAHRVAPLRLLWQAACAYTPASFELFKQEFDMCLLCIVYSCREIGTSLECEVSVKDKRGSHLVRLDVVDSSVICSCKKFEYVGIPCCHMLKILEVRNITELPSHLILKRWRKDAQNFDPVSATDDGQRSSVFKRYNAVYGMLYRIAARAAESVDSCVFMENQLDQILEQVEQILQARPQNKPLGNGIFVKGHHQIAAQATNSSNEPHRAGGKKNKSGEPRHRQNSPLRPSKTKKLRQVLQVEVEPDQLPLIPEEPPVSHDFPPPHLRAQPNQYLAPSQLLQVPFLPPQHYGLGSLQGFHGISQLSQIQEPSPGTLQPAPPMQISSFHAASQITQGVMQGPPPQDLQALQFLSNNPHLGQQSDQQTYIPVWDFL